MEQRLLLTRNTFSDVFGLFSAVIRPGPDAICDFQEQSALPVVELMTKLYYFMKSTFTAPTVSVLESFMVILDTV